MVKVGVNRLGTTGELLRRSTRGDIVTDVTVNRRRARIWQKVTALLRRYLQIT